MSLTLGNVTLSHERTVSRFDVVRFETTTSVLLVNLVGFRLRKQVVSSPLDSRPFGTVVSDITRVQTLFELSVRSGVPNV